MKDNEQEVYKLNFMLDEYYNKFNKEDNIKLGIPNNLESSKSKYYNFYFNKKEKKDIIKEYLEGLYWINEYYYNNRLCTDWFYKNFKAHL